ncbi:hypothetical protein D3C79_994330 [compost metagenome]
MRIAASNSGTANVTPASRAATCGAIAGSKANGLTCSYGNLIVLSSISAWASLLRKPFGVMVQPEATGLAPRVLMPCKRAACKSPAAMVVLPTSVSVPAMK